MKFKDGSASKGKPISAKDVHRAEDSPAQAFENLLEELMKDSPDQSKIKRLSHHLGLKYSKDTLYQMDQLLKCSSTFETKVSKRKKRELFA